MNNLSIVDFRFTIEKFIREYDLPIECKRMVVKEVYDNLKAEAESTIYREVEERERKEKVIE